MGIIENAKEAVKLVQQIDNMELYRNILDLQAEALELVQQLKEKDETIEKLKTALELKGKMVCEHSAYWIKDDQGSKTDGPFCTNCFDNEHATRRLVQGGKPSNKGGHDWSWIQCPKCKVPFRQEALGRYLNAR